MGKDGTFYHPHTWGKEAPTCGKKMHTYSSSYTLLQGGGYLGKGGAYLEAARPFPHK